MFEGQVDRERAAHRTADDMRAVDLEMLEERSQVGNSRIRRRRQGGVTEAPKVRPDHVELLGESGRLRFPHARVRDAGVDEKNREPRARALVMDARAVEGHVHQTSAVSRALNFSSVSSSSRAGSESGMTPTPAYNRAPSSQSNPQRSATANSPSPRPSIQPTAPAYQPRSIPSSSSMRLSAASRGQPPTAGGGGSAAAGSSGSAGGSCSSAVTEVARCWMFVNRTTSGGGAFTDRANGRSASTTNSETRRCSAASFALSLSCRASTSSSASVAPRATDPAIGCEKAREPERRTSSSGDAPANAVPSAPVMRYVKHDGYAPRNERATIAADTTPSPRSSTSRASTTLAASPPPRRAAAISTAAVHAIGFRTAVTSSLRAAGARRPVALNSRRASAFSEIEVAYVRPRTRVTASSGTRSSRAGKPDQGPPGSRSGR